MSVKKTKSIRRILHYIRPELKRFTLSLVLNIVAVALTLYVPVLIGRCVDCITGAGTVDFKTLFSMLNRILICLGTTALLQWIIGMVNNRITYRTVFRFRQDAFRKLQRLPIRYADSHRTGDIVSRMVADTDAFADGLLLGFSQMFSGIITILGTMFFMIRLNPWIALVVIVLTPLSLFVARFIARKTYRYFREQTRIRGEQTALTDEIISGQKLVQAFCHEDASLQAFDDVNERLRDCSHKATFFSSLTNPCTRCVNSIVYAAVTLSGALIAIGGGLTVGALTSFLSYANQYTKPFNEISGVVTELQNALACAERMLDLMDEEEETPDQANALRPETSEGQVTLTGVRFSYTPGQDLIRDMNLEARPGQRIAIVGPTGCGKTTLINLLMRFYDVQEGSITLDGNDIRSLTREGLRRQIGMVLQDTWLFSGTIRENIALGKPDATEEEIIAAAKAAHAHSFIRRLPEGYDTRVGENGAGLSQGQKQLLCISRLFLCPPPILILDEATSSIDTRTEQKIQHAFATLMQGRTSFIVAHRLSTIQDADLILVMKDGKLIEQGTHQNLLQKGGFYATLFQSQFEQGGTIS